MISIFKFVLLALFTALAYAEDDVKIDGQLSQSTTIPYHHQIQLLKLKISKQGQKKLKQRMMQQQQLKKINFQQHTSNLPSKLELGMANVPVLDQGPYGTCATFAVTAALDALSAKGDYISQLCSLSLSEYLSQHSQLHSMWNGAMPEDVFHLISMFGIINKENEQIHGCGGYHDYPMYFSENYPATDLDSFKQHAQGKYSIGYFSSSNYVNFAELLEQSSAIQQALVSTKQTIHDGSRVVVAIILIADKNVGAYGKHHQDNDTWVFSNDLYDQLVSDPAIGGHAMVITGYDDNAEAIDEQGNIHKGLFTLRNSWGPKAGDEGNYYISYDYFNSFVVDLTKIKMIPSNL